MKHLSGDELYRLSEAIEEMSLLDDEQFLQLEHLKTCRECYDKFCAMMAVMQATSDEGYMILEQSYNNSQQETEEAEAAAGAGENRSIADAGRHILAIVRIVRREVEGTLTAALDEARQLAGGLEFTPAYAGVGRGVAGGRRTAVRFEDIQDERTFFTYDPQADILTVQIHREPAEGKRLQVFIKYEDGEEIPIPLTRKGDRYTGRIEGMKETAFELYLQEI